MGIRIIHMNLLISHGSALEFWRNHSTRAINLAKNGRQQTAPTDAPNQKEVVSIARTLGLSLPVSVTVGDAQVRRLSQTIKPHLLTSPLPRGSLLDLGEGTLVASPELCYLQLAEQLSLIELVKLGMELCGSYSLAVDETKGGFINRPPLTTVSKLATYIERFSGKHGRRLATQALQYLADNSASPMETKLTMLLTLPYRLGGYRFPMPTLNARIVPTKTSKLSASKSHYFCDLYWPNFSLAVEYDSDSFHTGAERIADDSKRRNSLSALGITVITVTNRQMSGITEFRNVARHIASFMGRRLFGTHKPEFNLAQQKLRLLLH